MSKDTKKKIKKGTFWADEIIRYLKQNPAGLTITDIAKGIDTSRVTVTKYIPRLLEKGEIFAKEVGVYKLYFSSERDFLPLKTVRTFYKGVLSGLKGKLKEEDYKEIGYVVADHMRTILRTTFTDKIKPSKIESFKGFFEFIKDVYPLIEFLYDEKEVEMEIEEKINEKEDKAEYIFKNVKLLEISEDFKYHFYIWSGAFERLLGNLFKKNVSCNIIEIDMENKTVKVALEIH